ncbi:MAG: hypothetical protein HQ525_02745 [Anaerolineae bacterium]|uniref:Uncharacterized protein n=1 Tax=Candidatus Desulfolinea nitratireducens TaxID=2841698 RepID=A0A8J6TEZ3_9CHLR|nr:hypothetical protein [Candidatus Desulfolinea nitratireducens]MBL6960335.1 hypothetical protein [Anaerolineales bacterium]NQU29563.1 hypothetical protein [Anaerolineae bacterium]
MKKRVVYAILFGIPGFIISLIISFIFFGFAAGVLWILIFGDKPWPASVEYILSLIFILLFLVVWIASITIGFKVGKGLEEEPGLNKQHVFISAGTTLLFALFILLQQMSVGNVGPKSDGEICIDFCVQNGYSGSSMPPLDSGDSTCSCLGDSGIEPLEISVDSITPVK